MAAGISIAAIIGVTLGMSSARQVAFRQAATVTIPTFDHIVTVVMENHDYSQIIGNPSAPYINSLAATGALATNYQAVNHPSEPNYLALTSGNDFASNSCVTGDGDPAGACVVNATNIGDRLEAAGKTWKGYMESMPSPCYLTDSGEYGVRHDPFPYYQDIQGNPTRCQAHDVPYTRLATDFASTSTTPNYAFITPNVCNDMHDCSVATGDAWLKANLPTILTSPAWTTQKSLLMIVWDECGTCADPGNHVAMVMLGSPGSGVKAGGFRSATAYTHYSLLKTIESSWGLAPMTTKDSAASPMSDFFTTSPTPTATPTATPTVTPTPTPTPSSSIKYDFEDGTTQGWKTAWGPVTAVNDTKAAFTGTHSLAITLSPTSRSWPAVQVNHPTGLSAGMPVTCEVFTPAGSTITGVQPYVTDLNWSESFAPMTKTTPGAWTKVTWRVPSVNGFNALGLQVSDDGTTAWSGTIHLDTVTYGTTPTPTPSNVKYGFEGGTTQGWGPAWGKIATSNSSTVAYSGTHSLAIGLSSTGASYPAVEVAPPKAGLTVGGTVTYEVWEPVTATIAYVRPYVTDLNWIEVFAPAHTLTPGKWTTISWKVPRVNGFTTLGLEVDNPTAWRGTINLDTVAYGGTTTSPTPTPTPIPAPTTGAPKIHVSGNHIVNANGNVVQLRGVNRSGAEYACAEGWGIFDGPTDNATSIAAMKSWHVNTVRLPMNEDCWLGINGVNPLYAGANYRNAIVKYVNDLNAQGIIVILNLHFSAPGTTVPDAQSPMADRDHSPAFWTSVATVFKNNHSVLFDLFNEPYPDSNQDTTAAWKCVLNGGTCPGVKFTAAGMQELTNAVRNTGATQPLMVAGPQYAGVVDHWTQYKPNDPLHQIVASIHIYGLPLDSPCRLQSCWDATMAPLATTTPIVIGELGDTDCTGHFSPPLLTWADAHGVSYTPWAWNVAGCAAEPSLITNYSGNPTAYGVGVRTHLLRFP